MPSKFTSDKSIGQSFVSLIGLDYVRLGMIRPEASERALLAVSFDVTALRKLRKSEIHVAIIKSAPAKSGLIIVARKRGENGSFCRSKSAKKTRITLMSHFVARDIS